MGADKRVVAVSGGTGFLGKHLVAALEKRGYSVRLITRKSYSTDSELRSICVGSYAVIHAAGVVSYKTQDKKQMWDVNVGLTKKTITEARAAGVHRFVYVSSIVTLGHGRDERNETAIYNATSLKLAYWDTKFEAEKIALAANAKDFEVVVANPGTLLGFGERGQLRPFVQALSKLPFAAVPDGGSDFVDANDVADGICLALEKGRAGERYIIGAENLTYRQLYLRLRQAIGKTGHALALPQWLLKSIRTGRFRRVNGVYLFHSIEKAKRELGYSPRRIDEALRIMLKEKCE